jgi:hypothetical protein
VLRGLFSKFCAKARIIAKFASFLQTSMQATSWQIAKLKIQLV